MIPQSRAGSILQIRKMLVSQSERLGGESKDPRQELGGASVSGKS